MTAPLLAPAELACGMVSGSTPRELGRDGGGVGEALDRAVLPALWNAPCLVSFSGGRDSSLVLAVATGAARRAGLPDPIPVTNRFPGVAGADETEWQELVVAHLGLRDWVRLPFSDELDAVGPVAQAVLRRHGLLWPFNAHFHAPLLIAARGGSLLTGVGGDELFSASVRPHAVALASRSARPVPRDAARLALALGPRALRRRRLARRHRGGFPWLTAAGERAVAGMLARHAAELPLRLAPRMRWALGFRYAGVGTDSLDLIAADAGARIAHPLLDPAVWGAVTRAAAPHGFTGRTAAMRALFGHLLPDALLSRRGKAGFDEVFFSSHSRHFVRSWNGAGTPAGLVDPDALREHWRGAAPMAQSFTLLQAASAGDRVEDAGAGLGERFPAARAAQAQHGQ